METNNVSMLYLMNNASFMRVMGYEDKDDSYYVTVEMVQNNRGQEYRTTHELSGGQISDLEKEVMSSGKPKDSKLKIRFHDIKSYVVCNQERGLIHKLGRNTGPWGTVARIFVKTNRT